MKKKEFLKLLDERLKGKTQEANVIRIIKDVLEAKCSFLSYRYMELKVNREDLTHPEYPDPDIDKKCEMYPDHLENSWMIREYNRTAMEVNLLKDILSRI